MNLRRPNYWTRDIHGTSRYVTAEFHRLKDIMDKLGHDRIDLLKLDIEGS